MKNSYKKQLTLPPGIRISVTWQKDLNVDQAGIDNYVNSLTRPNWYKHGFSNQYDTRLYMLEVHQPFKTTMVHGRLERVWTCECCKSPVFYSGIHLGHKVQWKTELKHAGVLNPNEAKAVYNNINNLRIECATCNTSHDWE
jgi:hypothetical protein